MIQRKNKLKPYHGIIFVLLAAADIFFISGYLGTWFGMYGSLLSELLLLALAVGTAAVSGGDLKKVFPVRRPKAHQVFGTLVLWLGTFFAASTVTMVITLLFPGEMTEISEGINSSIANIPFFAAFIIVVLSPAVCEEAAFRGVFFNSFFNPRRNKWVTIFITAAVFGAFHGSVWRFFPTFILGIAMGYVLMETGNMFYNVLFHAVNNSMSLLAVSALKFMGRSEGYDIEAVMEQSNVLVNIPLYSVGQCLAFYGSGSVVLLYIADHLLHKGQPGYDKGLFPREKRRTLLVLVVSAVGCVAVGMMLMMAGIAAQNFYG